MVRTFDFIFILKKSEKERDEIYRMMEAAENREYDLGGWHLKFEQERKVVTVTDNGTDACLSRKFDPAEISYDSLRYLIDPNDEGESECQIKYL